MEEYKHKFTDNVYVDEHPDLDMINKWRHGGDESYSEQDTVEQINIDEKGF